MNRRFANGLLMAGRTVDDDLAAAQPERPRDVVDAGDDGDNQRRTHQPGAGLRQRRVERQGTAPMASVCSAVLILPPRLAGMTPCRITQNRSAVTPHSRVSITTVTHHGSAPYADSNRNAAPVNALSAIGSATLPNDVTRSQVRAIHPSTRSVTAATKNATQAAMRRPGCVRPDATVNRTNTGTSTIRAAVRAFAAFTSGARPTRVDGRRLALLGDHDAVRRRRRRCRRRRGTHVRRTAPAGRRRQHLDRYGHQVDAVIADDPGSYEIAGAQHGQVRDVGAATIDVIDQQRRAIDLGCLVCGAALDTVATDRVDQHVDCRTDAILGALGTQLLGERAQFVVPAFDLVVIDLAGQARRLGAVLVGVVEDTDRVEAGVGEEALQLGDSRPRSHPGSRR